MAQYDGAAIVPTEAVCKDYFSHLTPTQFVRKVNAGDIDIVLTRIETSQKAALGVHIEDLADYIDKRRASARKENDQLHGRR
ncbi:pyocin activator PrtN family protein [Rhizobium sp. 18055]|uniref:pyocin activator PrtN family protein n=1 Tax=Rhizobium sp. 18055 TaxID=2681403 RepID=UPI00135A63F6|nr:pyocin activator PrtN family protein [Rhizobium sp. 18055]